MCNMGARQSENLSPFCFSLYINDDLENYLVQNDIKGVTILIENLETEMHTMLKLVILFYADDTFIFFWEPKQHKSLIFSNMICENFILTLKKTKVLFFFKRSYYKKKFIHAEMYLLKWWMSSYLLLCLTVEIFKVRKNIQPRKPQQLCMAYLKNKISTLKLICLIVLLAKS